MKFVVVKVDDWVGVSYVGVIMWVCILCLEWEVVEYLDCECGVIEYLDCGCVLFV